ncbi:glycine cleavage system protein GcvH [Actinocorallia sp. A-T 12471]|uniref:glycine cleavage system protein GcvH n=1 Tax=Actinocorallia sp. A-T 12471 TaxID=3089813 RepID=UPI0029CD4B81|nr:glycine cleavage system protein GcvH [Actinocorallia sp. A-T 12471]MDX6743660.1 glycine cleavage system protein GcvH [Actinocorallia sp. A-T 12471]
MSVPEQLRYTEEHEWVSGLDGEDGVVTVGITDYAADALGDIVFVQLPEEGQAVTAGEPCGEAESTKSVSDIYSPLSGEVVAVNQSVVDDPGIINADAYGEGWLFRIRIDEDQPDLLDAESYNKIIEEA